jgi:hypothetical protein
MAKQERNVVTYGLSGKIGDLLVFRQRDGKTIVSKVPQMSKTPSEKQKEHQHRFRQAIIYAQAAVHSPETKDVYESAAAAKRGRTPFIAAVADFLNAPGIHLIDLSGYTGQAGDTIRIEVSDDTLVKDVIVSIINANGSPVEEGAAQADVSGHIWTYTATETNDNLEGDKIVVSIHDFPQNVSKEEKIL